GFAAPAKTPRAVLEAFHAATLKALAAPETKRRLLAQGMEIVGGGPGELDRTIRDEVAKWGKLVKTAGITAEGSREGGNTRHAPRRSFLTRSGNGYAESRNEAHAGMGGHRGTDDDARRLQGLLDAADDTAHRVDGQRAGETAPQARPGAGRGRGDGAAHGTDTARQKGARRGGARGDRPPPAHVQGQGIRRRP